MRGEEAFDFAPLVMAISAIPSVVAVTLGGSRASGLEHAESDWDFCLYYRGGFDTGAIRKLGFPGEVYEPGDWGRFLNGGAWLRIGSEQVDLLYRDLDLVERSIAEAEEGRFEIEEAQGFLAGLPSYVLVGEVALGKLLVGELPSASFAAALRRSASSRWRGRADFSLWEAGFCARREEPVTCAGLLAKAAVADAHSRLAECGEWAFNEKAIVRRAGLADAGTILAEGVGTTTEELQSAVLRMRAALGRASPDG